MDGILGRQSELAAIEAALVDARSGRGALFLLVGEAGIGKTRLATEAAERARHAGFRVVWGRSAEGGGAPAYWPWTQILRTLIEERAFAPTPRQGADLSEILPELAAEHRPDHS